MTSWSTVELSTPELYIQSARDDAPPPMGHRYPGSLVGVQPDWQGGENAQIWVGWTYGVITLGITTHNIEPPLTDPHEWETVAEATIDLPVDAVLTRTTLSPYRPPDVDHLSTLPPGLHHLRVSANGRARDRNDVTILIQLWPAQTRVATRLVRSGDDFDLETFTNLRPPFHRRHIDPVGEIATSPSYSDRPSPRNCVHATPSSVVTDQWNRLRDIVDQRSTRYVWATLTAPGTGTNEIDSAQARTGVPWPPEIREWFTANNGPGRAQLIPGTDLLSVQQVVELHEEQRAIWQAVTPTETGFETAPASSQADTFLRAFVPITERDGTMLVCDTRPGPMRGCITEFGKDTADAYPPKWRSISALLTDLADSIEHQTSFDGYYTPDLTAKALKWHYSGAGGPGAL